MSKELQLTQENLEKALQTFGLSKTLVQDNPFLKVVKKDDSLNKGNQDELGKSEAGNVLLKALGISADDLQKAIKVHDEIQNFNKTWSDKTEEIIKGIGDFGTKYEALSKEVKAKDEIIKGLQETLNKQNETLDLIKKDIVTIGNTPNLRKSLLSTSFKEKESFEKGEGDGKENKDNKGKIVISLSKEPIKVRQAIEHQLDKEIEKGIKNGPFIKGAEFFDSSKRLSPEMISAFNEVGIIIEK